LPLLRLRGRGDFDALGARSDEGDRLGGLDGELTGQARSRRWGRRTPPRGHQHAQERTENAGQTTQWRCTFLALGPAFGFEAQRVPILRPRGTVALVATFCIP
jgi:hypothetical protein